MVVIDDVENIEKVRIYDKGVDLKPGEQFPYTSYTEAMSIRTGSPAQMLKMDSWWFAS